MQRDANSEGALSAILGYLNYSEGKPDSRFQKQLNHLYAVLAQGADAPRSDGNRTDAPRSGSARSASDRRPWEVLYDLLTEKLIELHQEGGAFQDIRQAEAVLSLIFTHVLPGYQQHHRDLLAHLSDTDLFQPFFLARAAEAVLAQGPLWEETERIKQGALNQLDNYLGYRPIAILETRPKGEPYSHERVRPIPLYIRGAGVAWGRFQTLIEQTIRILEKVDSNILAEASFDLDLLDELALDPRAYDQSHPAGRPRNYIFGEWDPHHLDDQGRFRRFVVRDVVLEALLDWAQIHGSPSVGFESAAVLAGTILMASGICGSSPTAHDSTVTLSKLIPRIARCREAYYAGVLELSGSTYGLEAAQTERLRQEAARLKQPFGGARQHLNEYLAKHRAGQMQHRHVALLYAEMGYVEASRHEANKIPAASTRFLTEIWIRLTSAQGNLTNDHSSPTNLKSQVAALANVEDVIRQGIDCGALPDPWNILGFQGMFPLSSAQEDSVRDPRLDDLIHIMECLFDLYSRLMSEAAAAGERTIVKSLTADMKRMAGWWDRFASVEVQDVRRVHGGEALASAEHVAESMARWHAKGEATGDLAFWKQHLEGFRTPKAFILVLEALLSKEDYRAAMALLMTWLNQVGQVPLEDGAYSIHLVAFRWIVGATSKTPVDWSLIQKFFDYLEANAEEYWNVPTWEPAEDGPHENEKEESPYSAAYEDVTYQDTTDDDVEGAVADGGGPPPDLDDEPEANRLTMRLRFISTVARLWQVAAWRSSRFPSNEIQSLAMPQWLEKALENQQELLRLLESIHDDPIPEPMGSYDSMLEYDRRRALKGYLLHTAVATGMDLYLAALAVRGALPAIEDRGSRIENRRSTNQDEPSAVLDPPSSILGEFTDQPTSTSPASSNSPPWEPLMHRLVEAMVKGDRAQARDLLPAFVQSFQKEPLLLPALSDQAHPKQILRVRIAQTMMRTLLAHLPRLGLFRETFDLLQTAREMERSNAPEGIALTEFNHLFQAAFEGLVETVVESSETWPAAAGDLPMSFSVTAEPESSEPKPIDPSTLSEQIGQIEASDIRLVEILEALTGPFFRLWVEHGQTVRVSAVEKLRPEEWGNVRTFVQRYGRDLFHVKFLTLANLRGILRGGILAFLDFLRENPDPLHPVLLIDDIESKGLRPGGLDVVHLLECILEIMVEYYDDYKEYNSTSPQSDFGDKLYVFLDFLRVKAAHQRHAWQLRPLHSTHEILVAYHQLESSDLWRQRGAQLTKPLTDQEVQELENLEKRHGLRLASISEQIRETFETSMEIDHLCALVEPAFRPPITQDLNSDSEYGISDRAAQHFGELRSRIDSRTANPTGTGIELPVWLARLGQKVRHIRSMQSDDLSLAEGFIEMAQLKLSLEDVRQQIQSWAPAPEGS